MENPTLIITGASRGLGAATAQIAARMGANVVINARSETDLKMIAEQIPENGKVLAVRGDVGEENDCRLLVLKTIEEFGRVDAIINNAGIIEPIAAIAKSSPANWQKSLNINLLGPMMMTQAALPYLRKRKGRVINVSSGAAVKAIQGWGAYCTAKAALNHFTRVLALEEPAITAISFRPGVVDTAMQKIIREEGANGMQRERYTQFVDLFAAGRLLPPEKPGKALALLALKAPHQLSGEFIQWDDERIQALDS